MVLVRITEVPEEDVFVCESMYEEARREIRKFDGLQKVTHKDPKVHKDEIYFFRRPISLIRVDVDGVIVHNSSKAKAGIKIESIGSPMSVIRSETESMMEDSLDAPPSIASSDAGGAIGGSGVASMTPNPKKQGKTPGKKLVTGYILYSCDVRKAVADKNQDKSFGEISRIVGNDVRTAI